MVYANQAGTSWPKPAAVREAVARTLSEPPERWSERFESERAEVASAFGVADPIRLLLTGSATSALSVGIADHPWQSGDRIVVSGLEHHALDRPARLLEARGVERVVVPRAGREPLDLDALEAELRRGRVRLVAMTAACNVTGEVLPIEDVVSLAHRHGALCLVDAAQVAGWWPLDVGSLGVDLLAFAGHKGPQAPVGIGALYVAPHVAMAPPGASCDARDARKACAPMPGYCDVGSVNRAALSGLVAGLRWLDEPPRADRLAVARRRIAELTERVAVLPGVTLCGEAPVAGRMPILALTVAGRVPEALAEALARRGVVASGGTQCAPLAHETLGTAPAGALRLSFGPSNGEGDAASVADALRECLGEPRQNR